MMRTACVVAHAATPFPGPTTTQTTQAITQAGSPEVLPHASLMISTVHSVQTHCISCIATLCLQNYMYALGNVLVCVETKGPKMAHGGWLLQYSWPLLLPKHFARTRLASSPSLTSVGSLYSQTSVVVLIYLPLPLLQRHVMIQLDDTEQLLQVVAQKKLSGR
jgi:hypothetical protein